MGTSKNSNLLTCCRQKRPVLMPVFFMLIISFFSAIANATNGIVSSCITQQKNNKKKFIGIASIADFSGSVMVRRNGQWTLLKQKHASLFNNDKVVTSEGRATLLVNDCAILELDKYSHLKIQQNSKSAGSSPQKRFRLLIGSLIYTSAKRSSSFLATLESPSTVVDFQGESISLGVNSKGTHGILAKGKWKITGDLIQTKPPMVKKKEADTDQVLLASREALAKKNDADRASAKLTASENIKNEVLAAQAKARSVIAFAREELLAAERMKKNASSQVRAMARKEAAKARNSLKQANKALKMANKAIQAVRAGKRKTARARKNASFKLADVAMKGYLKKIPVQQGTETDTLRMTGISIDRTMVIATGDLNGTMASSGSAYETQNINTNALRMTGISVDQPLVFSTETLTGMMTGLDQVAYTTKEISTLPLKMTGISIEQPMVLRTNALSATFTIEGESP